MKKNKVTFWHLITNVNPEKAKRDNYVEIGNFVTHRFAFDGRPSFINIKEGKEFWIYDIVFIAKLNSNIKGKELLNILTKKTKLKGYEKYILEEEKA